MQDIITEEAKAIKAYILKTWPTLFTVDLERPLREIFPEPTNRGLKHIWQYGAADIVVRKKGKIVSIIEPGGGQHFSDEKQKKNDSRKWKICDINNVRCLCVMNGVRRALSNRKWRSLLGRYLFGVRGSF